MAEPRVSQEGVPIDHLDYGYVRNCTNVKEVEKILKVLRSKSEGYYPDLIRFTETRLRALCPTSKLLIKSEQAKRLSDLSSEESQWINADLEQWTNQMSSAESHRTNGPTIGRLNRLEADSGGHDESDRTLPPIRTTGRFTKGQSGVGATNNDLAAGKSERIPSYDFRAWDKFDAEKEADRVDKSGKKSGPLPIFSPKGLPLELSKTEKSMSSVDKEKAALREKNKGNEAYRAGDHQEALVYYTRSINFHPTAPAYNNRAITEIKLGRHREAIRDCDEVLRLEHKNTKALFRRATAYTHVKEYRAAAGDLEHVLRLEPNNKKVQEELNHLRRDHLENAGQQKQPKKGKRIEIEESDGEDENISEGENEPAIVPTASKVQPERKESTDGPTSHGVKEEAEKGVDVGGHGATASKYSSNGPLSSPGSEGPTTTTPTETPPQRKETPPQQKEPPPQQKETPPQQKEPPPQQKETPPQQKETPPLNTKEASVPVQSTSAQQQEAPPTSEAVKDVPKHPQAPSTLETQQQLLEAPPTLVSEAPPPEPPPELPPLVKKLKEEGNDLFRRGQYGEAVSRYSKGIKTLEKSSKAHVPNISTLLNNRSACHLKNGNSRGCIDDCTKSLELVPVNLKALLRRAQAYETIEKYKDAYNDFHLALRVDSSVEAAYTACTRLTKILQDLDGHDWRSKLPPHPDGERVKAALAEHKYRSGSVGGLPLLSTLINVDQSSGVGGGGGDGDGDGNGVPSSNESSSDHHDSSASETPNVGGGVSDPTVVAGSASETTSGSKREKKKEERKEQAEERVPEIPPLNVTATSTSAPQVTQTTQPVPSPHCSEAPPPGPTLSQLPPEQKFEQLKAEGNEHVRKNEFVEALNCYSLCVNTCPNRVVAYTNRALCHLKLKSPRSAEDDCTIALSLDPNNVKALYRRALARKMLGKYKEATRDLKILLDFDPTNSVARQELMESKGLWEKNLRKIQVQQERAKEVASSRKSSKSGKSRKKSGQRKSSKEQGRVNPMAELQKTKQEIEKLLEEAAKLTGEAKKQTSPPNPSSRKSELDKLLKETKTKKKSSESKTGGSKAAERKATEGKATESMVTENRETERKVTEGKATESMVTENRETERKVTEGKAAGSKAAGSKETGSEATEAMVMETTAAASNTATSTEARVTEEKSSDVSTKGKSKKSKSESGGHMTTGGDHMTASKTTYYKGKSKRNNKAEKGAKTTPPKTTDAPVSKYAEPSSAGAGAKEKPASKEKRKKIVVEEGSETDDGEEVDGEATPSPATQQDNSTNAAQQEQTMTSEDVKMAYAQPDAKAKERLASPYEFVQRWNSIPRTAQSIEYARLLEQIAPETLPEVITNKLDGMMLTNIIRAIDKQFVPKRQYKTIVDILLYLTKVPRFQMNAMFLGPIEKEDLKSIFTVLSEHRDEISVPPAMLQTMRRSYGLDS